MNAEQKAEAMAEERIKLMAELSANQAGAGAAKGPLLLI